MRGQTAYRHLGQAIELITILNKRNSQDYELKSSLISHLEGAGIGHTEARRFVDAEFGDLHAINWSLHEFGKLISEENQTREE